MAILDLFKPKKKVYPVELDSSNFWSTIKNSDKPVLVDFFSPSCVPCRKLGPTVTDIATNMKDVVNVAALNVAEKGNSQIAAKLGIRSVPTLIVFKNGKAFQRSVGLAGYNKIKEMIEKSGG